MRFRGEFITETGYEPLDVVTYQGQTWICDALIIFAFEPPPDGTRWKLGAAKGGDGAPGADGGAGPAGADGAAGEQGPAGEGLSVNWQGPWSAESDYFQNDGVSHAGHSFASRQGSNLGNEPPWNPPTSDANWQLISARGPEGPQGPAGNDGMNGADGANGMDGVPGSPGDTGPAGHVYIQNTDPADGNTMDGDVWINSDSWDVSLRESGGWMAAGTIYGQTGPKGDPGPAGADGPPGPAHIYANTSDPAGGETVDGDVWINPSDGNVYTRSGGGWSYVGNIAGPAGANGADGANGVDGAPGEVSIAYLEGNSAANCDAVATLGMSVSDPPTQGEVQAIADKLDELIATLSRVI